MSPAHTPWTVPKRFTSAELYEMRQMTEWEIEDTEVCDALGRCLDEIERLYETAVAECYVDQPLPKIDDLLTQEVYPLVQTKVTLVAKWADSEEWIGVKARSVHAMVGSTKEQVTAYLDQVVGR